MKSKEIFNLFTITSLAIKKVFINFIQLSPNLISSYYALHNMQEYHICSTHKSHMPKLMLLMLKHYRNLTTENKHVYARLLITSYFLYFKSTFLYQLLHLMARILMYFLFQVIACVLHQHCSLFKSSILPYQLFKLMAIT